MIRASSHIRAITNWKKIPQNDYDRPPTLRPPLWTYSLNLRGRLYGVAVHKDLRDNVTVASICESHVADSHRELQARITIGNHWVMVVVVDPTVLHIFCVVAHSCYYNKAEIRIHGTHSQDGTTIGGNEPAVR